MFTHILPEDDERSKWRYANNVWGVSRKDCIRRNGRAFALGISRFLMAARPQEISVNQPLQMGMQMRLGLFNGKESMVPSALLHRQIEFEGFKSQVKEIRRTQASFSNSPPSAVNKETQCAEQAFGVRGGKAEHHFYGMGRANHRFQLSRYLCCKFFHLAYVRSCSGCF